MGNLYPDLARIDQELRDLSLSATPTLLHHLKALGVPWATIAHMGDRHFFGGSARVIEIGEGLYVLSREGKQHLILPVFEDGKLVDLVAFTSEQPMAWLLRLGTAWSLGLQDGLERHICEQEGRLWASPLDWLRADRDGLCVVDWSAPEVLELARLPNIRCQDIRLAERFLSALSRPCRLPVITYGEESRDAA